jgi:isopentenyl diphosphate isomerase/L-lactate dehydrogenase-like FMN-dependent dehydrogenase
MATVHDAAVNVDDWAALAAARLEPGPAGYLHGGAEDERTLADNRAAFARLRLAPRMLAGIAAPDLATTVLGRPVASPIGVAAVGHQGLFHPEGDVATSRACGERGALFCVSTMANFSLEEVAAAAPGGARWFQLYARREREHRLGLVARAADAGYEAIVLTVDLQAIGRRERDRRTGFVLPPELALPNFLSGRDGTLTLHETAQMMEHALGWQHVDELVDATDLPVVLKGILHPADVELAVEHGVAGIVVSNHGGRQLDGAVAAIDALPAIVQAAAGRLEVYVDGGVRRGVDVLAALARGARAVMVGRAAMYGLVAAGSDGVAAVLSQLDDELRTAMLLCGVAAVTDVPAGLVVSAPVP